jgi:uncharacterized protein
MTTVSTDLGTILEDTRTVAMVGWSTDPTKESAGVARILLEAGFNVIPVHPSADQVDGHRAYRRLADIPDAVDVVDVFRPPEEAPAIAEQAAAIRAKTLWLQLGIRSPEARRIAEDAGLSYVEDTCMGATTRLLGIRK